MVQPNGAVAELPDCVPAMGYKKQSLTCLFEVPNFVEALGLKALIAHRQHFIDDQDVRVHVNRHRKR